MAANKHLGIIGSSIAGRQKKTGGIRLMGKVMGPVVEQLKTDLNVLTTNEPINRKEGDIAQADLERENIPLFRRAITILKKV